MTERILRGDHCRCSLCGEYFNSTKAFDRHRRGDYRGDDRRCLTPEAMVDSGMGQNADRWWITAADKRAQGGLHADAGSGDPAEGIQVAGAAA